MATNADSDPVSLARRLYAVTSSGDVAQLDSLLGEDSVDHGIGGPDIDELRGIPAMREDLLAFRRSFPDAQITVEDAFAAEGGSRVAVRWTLTATHQDSFQGIPATGRSVSMRGIDIVRVENGRIVERWGSSDELGLLQQIVDRRQNERRATKEEAAAQSERRQGGRRQGDLPSSG